MVNTKKQTAQEKFSAVAATRSYMAIAEELGVSKSMVGHIVKGHRTPGLRLAARIEELYGVPATGWFESAA